MRFTLYSFLSVFVVTSFTHYFLQQEKCLLHLLIKTVMNVRYNIIKYLKQKMIQRLIIKDCFVKTRYDFGLYQIFNYKIVPIMISVALQFVVPKICIHKFCFSLVGQRKYNIKRLSRWWYQNANLVDWNGWYWLEHYTRRNT